MIIDVKRIEAMLAYGANAQKSLALNVIKKAESLTGLTGKEVSVLLHTKDPEVIDTLYKTARVIKERVYGKRLVFFAPLYVSNVCSNNCLYCAFRKDNKELKRKILTMDEVGSEIEILLSEGHKRILVVAGEHEKLSGIDYLEEVIRTIYDTSWNGQKIRRVNVNCAPLGVEDFRRLKAAGIGTYQIFQEVYHPDVYKIMHPSGQKANYEWRLTAIDRAFEAGIDDIGIGPLLGLYDYRFEILGMMEHIRYLEEKFGLGPHTISVPRLEPALNSSVAMNPPYEVADEDFKKIVATLRLAVPYTGMILSTREAPGYRDEVFELGISQISAGSCVSPGAYKENHLHENTESQFEVADSRGLLELINSTSKQGFIPSFCTACYRQGRTGEAFMGLAKEGEIHHMCLPNALLSLQEYLIDFADPQTRELGERIIKENIEKLDTSMKYEVEKDLELVKSGQRDVYV